MPGPDANAPRPGRVVIESVEPEIDSGRFAAKRIAGDSVRVLADVFADGHDELAAQILYRREDQQTWHTAPMAYFDNDRWLGEFCVEEVACYCYKLEAWVDHFATWQRDLQLRLEGGQDLELELKIGAAMLREAVNGAPESEGRLLSFIADALERPDLEQSDRVAAALEETPTRLMHQYASHEPVTTYDRGQRISVERERARFGAWYELFPRSTASRPGYHGSLATTIDRLPYIAELGFDVLYLPPIHPIGETNRKGKNNNPVSQRGEVGSPWAVGSKEGGHTAIHPDLGGLRDFKALMDAAKEYNIELALDIAYQCSPDHPWVKEHPNWFKQLPDGSIRFAENPPKKYQDIYPIDFETKDWQALWHALEGVVRFWCEQGVRIFRVDNPHTKAFTFWEWMISGIRKDYPDAIFLSEAFTAPRKMQYLSKLGFSQSYTYFTWRNTKEEVGGYLEELTQGPAREYFRPNLWPNTPDILHAYLQVGGRPAFMTRFLLASTLGASYGIYGAAFELGDNTAREPGSEEYLDSEKYEVKFYDLDAPHSLRDLIATVNKIRHENPALQRNDTLRFLEIDNDQLLAYVKTSVDGTNRIVCIVSLDPRAGQSGNLWLPLEELGLPVADQFVVEDLLKGTVEGWSGPRKIINLHPSDSQAKLLRISLVSEYEAKLAEERV